MIAAREVGATLAVAGGAGLVVASVLWCAGLPEMMRPAAGLLASGLALWGVAACWDALRLAAMVARIRAAMGAR